MRKTKQVEVSRSLWVLALFGWVGGASGGQEDLAKPANSWPTLLIIQGKLRPDAGEINQTTISGWEGLALARPALG